MHLPRSCLLLLIQGSIALLVSAGLGGAAGDGGTTAGNVPQIHLFPPPASPGKTSIPKLRVFCGRRRVGKRGGGSQAGLGMEAPPEHPKTCTPPAERSRCGYQGTAGQAALSSAPPGQRGVCWAAPG